jgi:Uma2 family endonuclease
MTATVEQPQAPRLKKWTQEEYLRLVEREAFGKQRVYLFRGDIIEMPPQSHPHQYAIMELDRYLHEAYKRPYRIRIQLPFITPGDSVPEPEAAVCTEADAIRVPSPDYAELVVEVSYSSLREDRALAAEYAGARVPEYWIIDVDQRCVEVYRNPVEDAAAVHGCRYAQTHVVKLGGEIAPQNRPEARVPIRIFFPAS